MQLPPLRRGTFPGRANTELEHLCHAPCPCLFLHRGTGTHQLHTFPSVPVLHPFSPAGRAPDPDKPVEAAGLQFSSSPVPAGGWNSRMRNPCCLQGSSLLHTEQIGTTTEPGAEQCLGCLCLNSAKGPARKQGSENKKFLTGVSHKIAVLHYRKAKAGAPTVAICGRDCYVQWSCINRVQK